MKGERDERVFSVSRYLDKCLLIAFIIHNVQAKEGVADTPLLSIWLDEFNNELENVRHLEADAAWNASTKITPENQLKLQNIQTIK